MENNPNPHNPTDNPTSGKSGEVTPPAGGSLNEVTPEQTLAPKEELAEINQHIEDISGDMNAEVAEAIKKEKTKKANDEKNSNSLENNYDELMKFEIEEHEPKSNTKFILGALVIGVGFGWWALRGKKPKKEAIQKELDNGVKTDVKTDKDTGMFY